MKIIFTVIISYLIGSFSSAYFIGKVFKKVDIRKSGSGNAGATNAVRVMGKKLGVLTFLLDFVKGIIAVLLGNLIMGYDGGLLAAIFVVIGHDWPVFLGFKGGKGISTTIGCYAILNFPIALISVILGIAVGLISKFVSLGSIVFLISMPVLYLLLSKEFNKNFLLLTIAFAIIGIYKHKGNIKRLLNGEENRIGG